MAEYVVPIVIAAIGAAASGYSTYSSSRESAKAKARQKKEQEFLLKKQDKDEKQRVQAAAAARTQARRTALSNQGFNSLFSGPQLGYSTESAGGARTTLLGS